MNAKTVAWALIGGVIGTVAMTFMAYFIAPKMLGHPMDIARMVAGWLGVGWNIGMSIHLINGIVVFPLVYVFLIAPNLSGPPWLKGLLWGIALWLGLEVVMLPMTGSGLFGNEGGPKSVMAALIAHLIYGVVLGATIGTTPAGVALFKKPIGLRRRATPQH
jgi:hypothetical protein